MKNKTLFPAIHGFKIGLGVENFEPWNDRELSSIMYHLQGEDSDSVDLLHESCSPEEADAIMNPGTDTVYEAVTAIYNRLGSTAKALARVFSRNLSNGLSIDGEPYVGPDRRNALFAYKTVTLSASDGQTISILFHSPDDNPRKFTPSETLIAYRFMLNKKDITATVAPVRGVELTLNIMASKMAQLLEANSPKFIKANEDREAVANELSEVSAKREELRGKIAENIGKEATINEKIAAEDRKAAKLASQLTDVRERNENLKAMAEADVKAEAGAEAQGKGYPDNVVTVYKTKSGKDGAVIKRTGNDRYSYSGEWGAGSIDKNEMLKAVRGWKKSKRGYSLGHGVDFEVYAGGVTPEWYQSNMGSTESLAPYQDALDSLFQGRIVAVRNALRTLGWEGEQGSDLTKNGAKATFVFDQVGAGANVVGMTINGLRDDLGGTPEDLAKAVDDAAASTNPDNPSSEQGFVTHNFTDRRTQVAAALAEELETAGFTPASFPIDNPDFVLAENSPVAFEKTLTGNGSVLLNSVLEDGTMNIELSYTEQSQPGAPNDTSRKEIQAKVPFGILESKFDDVVSQIEAFFMQFRTPLDDIELPAMGEKLKQEGINQHDVVEIAKAIRKDIKAVLPEGFKPSFISVKTSSYSGGASINVSIKKVAEGFKVMETENTYSREMLALIKVITAVGNAYRYDNSDSMTDYSDTNFFYFVGVASELKAFEQELDSELAEGEILSKAVKMSASEVKALNNEEFFNIEALMEDWNWHSERVAFQSKRYLGGLDVKAAEEVINEHQKAGQMTEDNYEKRSELSKKIRDAKAALEKVPNPTIAPEAISEPESMSESEAIGQELQALLNESDSSIVDQELDVLADKAEKANAMEELDGLLNQVADHLTNLLSKEAEGA